MSVVILRPGRFILGEKAPVSIGYKARTSLERMAKNKIHAPARMRTLVVQPLDWSLY
jgi:hypothetical protein